MSLKTELTDRQLDADTNLVEALRRHEPKAPEQLVNAYGARAYRLATGIIGNGPDAEEVVREALWTVIRKIDRFKGDSAFLPWLYGIVVGACCRKLRSRRRRRRDVSWDDVQPRFDEDGQHVALTTDWSARTTDPVVRGELREALTAAIKRLPETDRAVLVLRDVEGLSNVEVADTLSLNVPIVRARVHRARLFLRKYMGDAMITRGAYA